MESTGPALPWLQARQLPFGTRYGTVPTSYPVARIVLVGCFRSAFSLPRILSLSGRCEAMADEQWGSSLHQYYNRQPYWLATQDFAGNHRLDH
jgi:hypothetical protein